MKAAYHASPLQLLCQEELRAVTIPEIEAAERALLEGCDYRLRCHHPYGAIKILASDISNYLMNSTLEHQSGLLVGKDIVNDSSRAAVSFKSHPYGDLSTLCERALSVAQSALVYSDVNFLFPPGQIAFAALAIALDGFGYGTKLGGGIRDYLVMRFRNKSVAELSEFESQLGKIVSIWEDCPGIDLNKFAPNWHFGGGELEAENHASELGRVFHVASRLRTYKMMMPVINTQTTGHVLPLAHALQNHNQYPYTHHPPYYQQCHRHLHQHPERMQHSTSFVPIHENGGNNCSGSSKRRREDVDSRCRHYLPQQYHQYAPSPHYTHFNQSSNKVARVTPVMMDY
jgi:hypothetical protein